MWRVHAECIKSVADILLSVDVPVLLLSSVVCSDTLFV